MVIHSAHSAPAPAPQKQSLTFPLLTSTQSNSPTTCVVTFGPVTPISALAFSLDGKTLVVGGYQEVLVWDLVNARLLKRIGTGQLSDAVHALAFNKDGRLLAVGEGMPRQSGAVKIFNPETGELTASFQEPKDVVDAIAFSPDGKLLAAGGADPLVRVWNLEEKKLVATIKEHSDWVSGVAFSPDGKYLATASADNTAQIWEVETWKSFTKIQQTDAVQGVAFGPDGAFLALAVGGPNDRAVRIRQIDYNRQTNTTATARPARRSNTLQTRMLDTRAGLPLDVVWNMQGNRIYAPCSDKTVKVVNAASGTLAATLSGHADWVYCAALSPDGTRLASGSADGTVKLWSALDHRLLATLIQLSPRTDEWLILTPQGHFATSSARALQWKTADVMPASEESTSRLQNPELVRESLLAKPIATPGRSAPRGSEEKPRRRNAGRAVNQ
ncbi:MAG: WD40 repeat domain-containing protein [Verrucomicrobiota bacterium]